MASQAALPGIALGISIGLVASFVQSLGLTVQRKSHVLNEKLPEDQQKADYRRPLWLLGFMVFISSNLIGSLVQIAALPVVILGPLGAISLLWNALFACFLLGDRLTIWMVLGSILIAGGAVMIALFGLVPEITHSLDELLELFRRPTFIVYFSLLGFSLGVCLITTHLTEFSLHRRLAQAGIETPPLSPTTTPSGLTTGVVDTITEAATTERTPLLDRKAASSSFKGYTPSTVSFADAAKRTRMLLALAYAASSGILSGMCLLFAKSAVELILLTLSGKNQFWRWEAWILVLGLAIFALLQLWYLHKALVLADPTLVCPSAFCFYNLSCIVNGLVYFDQFSQISALHLFLVAVGIVVLLGGVWVISIQAGDGPFEPETWTPEGSEDDGSDGQSSIHSDEHRDLERGDDQQEGRPSRTTSFVRPLHSEPLLSTQSDLPRPSRSRPPRLHMPGDQHERHVSDPSTILLSPGLPRSARRRDTNPMSPPLGGGLQIGLAPVNTDFALLVAARRRRKLSGMSNTGDFAAHEAQSRMRRSISEGGISHSSDADEEQPLFRGPGRDEYPTEGGPRRSPDARLRWRWLKGLFTSR